MSSLRALLESQLEAEKTSPLPLWRMCLAPKARHACRSPPQDGFAVANLGHRPSAL